MLHPSQSSRQLSSTLLRCLHPWYSEPIQGRRFDRKSQTQRHQNMHTFAAMQNSPPFTFVDALPFQHEIANSKSSSQCPASGCFAGSRRHRFGRASHGLPLISTPPPAPHTSDWTWRKPHHTPNTIPNGSTGPCVVQSSLCGAHCFILYLQEKKSKFSGYSQRWLCSVVVITPDFEPKNSGDPGSVRTPVRSLLGAVN